jgi:hypothetical protein
VLFPALVSSQRELVLSPTLHRLPELKYSVSVPRECFGQIDSLVLRVRTEGRQAGRGSEPTDRMWSYKTRYRSMMRDPRCS